MMENVALHPQAPPVKLSLELLQRMEEVVLGVIAVALGTKTMKISATMLQHYSI